MHISRQRPPSLYNKHPSQRPCKRLGPRRGGAWNCRGPGMRRHQEKTSEPWAPQEHRCPPIRLLQVDLCSNTKARRAWINRHSSTYSRRQPLRLFTFSPHDGSAKHSAPRGPNGGPLSSP